MSGARGRQCVTAAAEIETQIGQIEREHGRARPANGFGRRERSGGLCFGGRVVITLERRLILAKMRAHGIDIGWLEGPWIARASLILVNLWLGYPYMFLVCTGALQSIPKDLKEAAYVDGATGRTAFRKVTFPLLLVAVSPLLIASFAFNFNNFTIIYLLTNGGPRLSGESAGATDILLSWSYRIALDGDLPVNPHGGQLSEGRTHGFGFIYEAIAQLRHEAGDRQVAGARTAVVTSGGGTPSGVMLLQRDGA